MHDIIVEQQSAVTGIQQLIRQFRFVFPDDTPPGLPPDRGISHAIPLQADATVPASKVYRLSKPQKEEMVSQINSLLRTAGSGHPHHHMVAPFSLLKRKMVACACVLIIEQ